MVLIIRFTHFCFGYTSIKICQGANADLRPIFRNNIVGIKLFPPNPQHIHFIYLIMKLHILPPCKFVGRRLSLLCIALSRSSGRGCWDWFGFGLHREGEGADRASIFDPLNGKKEAGSF